MYAFRKLSIEFPSRGHNTVTYRKLENFNSHRFRNDIFLQNWDDIYCHDNPNDMWDAWKSYFSVVLIGMHAPLRTKRVRSCKSPWITPLLKKRMHERDLLKMKASRSKDCNDWRMFKALRNQVNFEIKQAKVSFYRDALDSNKGNSRETWRIINELHNGTSILLTQMSCKTHLMIIFQVLGLDLLTKFLTT